MSGGVDSSVAALLLKQQGHEVIGLFMKNWEDENCPAEQDYEDVARVCEKIGIDYYTVNFSKDYWANVFAGFLEDYQAGRTPNPDILCNSEIKFKVFFDKAMDLGADYLATGHYCQTDGQGHLIKGLDKNKDQSYFLHQVESEVLKKVLFPIGHMEKAQVRQIALDHDLITHDKKDSTGICFIGERKFRDFLSEYIQKTQGNFETLEGQIVGEHRGTPFYTLGQRKGLGLGGPGEPWFVVGKDLDRNVVQVVRGKTHPALYTDWIEVDDLHFIGEPPKFPFHGKGKLRYRQPDQDCIVEKTANGYRVSFENPQRAATIGQSFVLYSDNICLGGGVIERLSQTYFEASKPLPEALIR
jgi:tRNA-specific 2-thiouridylase